MFAFLLFSICYLTIYSAAFPIVEESNDRPIIGKFNFILFFEASPLQLTFCQTSPSGGS